MKKLLLFICFFFIFLSNIYAEDKIEVNFNKCIDGDTAKVSLNKEIIKIRFLAVDTPETKHPTKKEELYGKEASNYTCQKLTNAKLIEIEYDNNSNKFDKYGRHLVWIFVDNELLQEQLVKNGLAKVAYLYNDYKYTPILESVQVSAQKKKLGIWSNNNDNYSMIYITIPIVLLILLLIFNPKFRKKMFNKFKRKAKNKFNKILKS